LISVCNFTKNGFIEEGKESKLGGWVLGLWGNFSEVEGWGRVPRFQGFQK
jgi:hypothetical protein